MERSLLHGLHLNKNVLPVCTIPAKALVSAPIDVLVLGAGTEYAGIEFY